MSHWNEMYWEPYLFNQTNTQTVISLKTSGPKRVNGQNGINITWNNDQNVKLVKQLMKDIRSFLQKWHNIVILLTAHVHKFNEVQIPIVLNSTTDSIYGKIVLWRSLLIKIGTLYTWDVMVNSFPWPPCHLNCIYFYWRQAPIPPFMLIHFN